MSFPFKYSLHEAGCVLYIKHMVCPRGIRVVRQELEKLGLVVPEVRLGAATVARPASELDWGRIREALARAGFDLLEDPQYALVLQVKQAVAQLLRGPDTVAHRDFIPVLAQAVGLSERQLHRLFAQLPDHENLPGYITHQRLSYAQELLAAPANPGIGQVARQLGYRSLAHFSGQFRRFAQCAPSAYRQQLRVASAAAVLDAGALNSASWQAEYVKPGA